MTAHLEYYKILGFEDTTPTAEEIKAAYRTLAKKHHPDLNQTEDEEEKTAINDRFAKIQTAYETLYDEEKRKIYDKYGVESKSSDEIDITHAAEVNLVGLWEQVLDSMSESRIATANFKEIMNSSIRDTRLGFVGQQKNAEHIINKLNKALTRITVGSTKNLLVEFINDKIELQNSNIKSLSKHIRVLDKVVEILEDYDFTTPPPQQPIMEFDISKSYGGGGGGTTGGRVIFRNSGNPVKGA